MPSPRADVFGLGMREAAAECASCGSAFLEDDNFCVTCGRPRLASQAEPQAMSVMAALSNPAPVETRYNDLLFETAREAAGTQPLLEPLVELTPKALPRAHVQASSCGAEVPAVEPDLSGCQAGGSTATTAQLDLSLLDTGNGSAILVPKQGEDFYKLLQTLADDLHALLGRQGEQTKKNMDLSAPSRYEAGQAEEKEKERVNVDIQTECIPMESHMDRTGSANGLYHDNFKQEVQVALHTLLSEQEKSVSLLNSVASRLDVIDENGVYGLSQTPKHSGQAFPPAPSPSSDGNSSHGTAQCLAECDQVLERVQLEYVEANALLGTVMGDEPKKRLSVQDMAQKIARTDFAVEEYEFLSPEGSIVPLPGLIERKLPKLASCLERLGREPDEPPQGLCTRFVESNVFKISSVLVIMINFGVMIWQTDWKMFNLNVADPPEFLLIAIAFTSFYVFECGIQVFVHGTRHFFGSEWGWNWFDALIVFASLVELFVKLLGLRSINLSFLRVLRFMRISKLLRMFNALRVFKEIKLMVDMLQGSFTFFTWCSMMLALFLSVFAIFFVQGTASLLEETENMDEESREELLLYFGTVSLAMSSLFQAVTGGNDWAQFFDVVKKVGDVYAFLWLFFIAFSLVAFFNVIGGVFCEKALSLAVPTMQEQMQDRILQDVRDAAELSDLLNTYVHHGHTFCLTRESFQEFLQSPDVQLYFEVRGLHNSTAERFFEMLMSAEGSSSLPFRKFISACVRFDSQASSIDVHVLHAELEAMRVSTSQFQKLMLQRLHR